MEENKYFENIATYKLLAKHEVGQNFLIDKDVAKRIVDLADIKDDDNVLEIGSGAGSLSFYILQHNAHSTLIDIDEGLITKLINDFANKENAKILVKNAMKFDYKGYTKIISNLPYYITSGILKNVLIDATQCKKAVFMVQSEAYDRLFSKLGTKEYSPLGILLEYRTKKTTSFKVSRNAFVPAPHIDSTVFALEFNQTKNDVDLKEFYDLLSALFLNRRKTIENNLSRAVGSKEKATSILKAVNIDPKARPEQIKLKDYLKIYSEARR